MAIPITTGTGAASVAAETVGGNSFQQVEIYGGGGASVLSINANGSIGVSILGVVPVTFAAASNQSVSGTVGASIIGLAPVNVTNTNINVSGSVVAFATITSIATINGGLQLWSPITSRIQGNADLRVVQGASVTAIAAQGAGVRTYIDHVQIANFGSSSVLVTIADNTTSILGYSIAPAGGGSNFDCFYRPAANSPITASINGTASVLVSMQGFTSAT